MIIQKIVIAGAGTMGSSMAQIYAEYFDDVVLYNHRQETLERAKERIESNVATLVETGNLTKEKAGSLLGALSYTTSMECFKTCECHEIWTWIPLRLSWTVGSSRFWWSGHLHPHQQLSDERPVRFQRSAGVDAGTF